MTPKDALEFYADPRRYQGANQRPIEGDKFARPDAVYIQDVTRDNGDIARRALATLTTPAPGRDAWSYQIQHGPDGEANYAWVHDHNGDLVCTAKTHHAKQIVDAILSALPVAPVVDEAGIRADEREKQRERDAELADCLADEYDATSFTSTNADQVAALRSKEQAARAIAQAIRAGGGER